MLPLGTASDERLAALVAEGHERAFAAIYSRYHQRLYRYCMTMLRNDADAQDALQSAFAAAYAALTDSRRNAPLRPWLFRIVHNEAISLLRRRRPDTGLSEIAELEDIGVEEQAGRRAELQALIGDLRELPDRQRAALVMRELSGLSHEEIAQALEVSPAAAKQTIFEARKSLMEFAAGREVSCEEIRRTLSDGDGRAARARRVRGHLSACAGCTEFAAEIRRRRVALRALAPPLPALMAQQLLGRVLRASGAHGGGAPIAAGGAGLAGKLSAAAVSTKAIAGVAVVVTAGAGVGVLHHALQHAPPAARPARAVPVSPASAAADRSVGRVITVRAHGGAAAGGRTAREVHRLRHGFWAPPGHGHAGGRTTSTSAGAKGNAGSHRGGAAVAHGPGSGAQNAAGARNAAGGRGGTHGVGAVHRAGAPGHVTVPARPSVPGSRRSSTAGTNRGAARGQATAPGQATGSTGARSTPRRGQLTIPGVTTTAAPASTRTVAGGAATAVSAPAS